MSTLAIYAQAAMGGKATQMARWLGVELDKGGEVAASPFLVVKNITSGWYDCYDLKTEDFVISCMEPIFVVHMATWWNRERKDRGYPN